MELDDIAKQELKTHMNIELGRDQSTSSEQMELETCMKLELNSYSAILDYNTKTL